MVMDKSEIRRSRAAILLLGKLYFETIETRDKDRQSYQRLGIEFGLEQEFLEVMNQIRSFLGYPYPVNNAPSLYYKMRDRYRKIGPNC